PRGVPAADRPLLVVAPDGAGASAGVRGGAGAARAPRPACPARPGPRRRRRARLRGDRDTPGGGEHSRVVGWGCDRRPTRGHPDLLVEHGVLGGWRRPGTLLPRPGGSASGHLPAAGARELGPRRPPAGAGRPPGGAAAAIPGLSRGRRR